jgi:hypothetical protein
MSGLAVRRFEACGNRTVREPGIVLHTGEALLLRRVLDATVDDQRRGGVVVIRGNSQARMAVTLSSVRTACR